MTYRYVNYRYLQPDSAKCSVHEEKLKYLYTHEALYTYQFMNTTYNSILLYLDYTCSSKRFVVVNFSYHCMYLNLNHKHLTVTTHMGNINL